MHVAREYRIDCKSFTIDNTSENTTAIEIWKNYLKPILNGFFIFNAFVILLTCVYKMVINDYILKLRDTIIFTKSSGPKKQAFR